MTFVALVLLAVPTAALAVMLAAVALKPSVTCGLHAVVSHLCTLRVIVAVVARVASLRTRQVSTT